MNQKEEARLEYAKKSKYRRPKDIIHPSARIHKKALIGEDGFGWARDHDGTLVKMQHSGNVIIEKDVEIGAFVQVDRAVNGSTIVGEGTKVQHGVNIGHGAKIGRNVIIVHNSTICGQAEIGDNCFLGAGCRIIQKVKVGNNCMIGIGSVVLKDVPDNTTVRGLWKGEAKVTYKYDYEAGR